jgi:hypothetical protein
MSGARIPAGFVIRKAIRLTLRNLCEATLTKTGRLEEAGMDEMIRDREPLSIPTFASARCREMVEEVILALKKIPPVDDQALEDRALACFVVACGELALMQNKGQREAIIAELSVVARRLTTNSAKSPDPDERPAPHVGMTWDQLVAVLKQEKAARHRA